MADNDTTLVTGAGGFIGGHLVSSLVESGHRVRAVDIKPVDEWYQVNPDAQSQQVDCSDLDQCHTAMTGIASVYNLASDMGGMGFIENNKALCMLSVRINTHLLMAARAAGVDRYFFASSACVYAADRQVSSDVTGLKEEDAYPAMPEDGYGWEKLFGERMCRHFREDFGLETRVARYHNVYGPWGTYDGGREKAPAAICRKVAQAVIDGRDTIEIWGDGEQTRSFMWIDDCLQGTRMLQASDFSDPINIGSEELVSINQLVSLVESIAGVSLARQYKLDAPQGVRGRNSDNTLIRKVFDWEPSTPLAQGMEKTYAWVYDQLRSGGSNRFR